MSKKFLFYLAVFLGAFWLVFLSLRQPELTSASNLPPIDKIIVRKSERTLQLLSAGQVIKTYKIALGRNPLGHKQREGDSKTPEGCYHITHHNPNSAYHLSLGISYPNLQDRENAKKLGVFAGGNIMIHGQPNFMPFFGRMHSLIDWTQGCIAVTNAEIEEIYTAVPDQTPIEIMP